MRPYLSRAGRNALRRYKYLSQPVLLLHANITNIRKIHPSPTIRRFVLSSIYRKRQGREFRVPIVEKPIGTKITTRPPRPIPSFSPVHELKSRVT